MSLGKHQVKDDIRYYIHEGSFHNEYGRERDGYIPVEDRYDVPEDYPLIGSARAFKQLYAIANFVGIKKLAVYFYVKMVAKQLDHEADIRQAKLDEEWAARVRYVEMVCAGVDEKRESADKSPEFKRATKALDKILNKGKKTKRKKK